MLNVWMIIGYVIPSWSDVLYLILFTFVIINTLRLIIVMDLFLLRCNYFLIILWR